MRAKTRERLEDFRIAMRELDKAAMALDARRNTGDYYGASVLAFETRGAAGNAITAARAIPFVTRLRERISIIDLEAKRDAAHITALAAGMMSDIFE